MNNNSKKLTKKQLDSKAHELFPMFQVMPNEGIEDVIDRVIPELRKLTDLSRQGQNKGKHYEKY